MRLAQTVAQRQTIVERAEYAAELLILFASPLVRIDEDQRKVGSLPISVEREIEAIRDAHAKFESLEIQINCEVLTEANLARVLSRSVRPLIVHFIGHGLKDGNQFAICAESQDGLETSLSLAVLRRLLGRRNRGPMCKLAILNCCHGGAIAELLCDTGVEHVIAVESGQKILDDCAYEFAKGIYPFIFANSLSMQEIFEVAQLRLTASLKGRSVEGLTALEQACSLHLYPLNSTRHNEPFTLQGDTGQLHVLEFGSTNISRRVALPFLGRQLEVHSVLKAFSNSSTNVVAINGIGGIGKTAVAEGVARWLLQRHQKIREIWKVSLTEVVDSTVAVGLLAAALGLERANIDLIRRSLVPDSTLILLDDVDQLSLAQPDAFRQLLQSLREVSGVLLLLTSRRKLPDSICYQSVDIRPTDRFSSRQMFLTYLGEYKSLASEQIDELLNLLDGHPFAIRLAAAHMRHTRCGLHRLVKRISESPKTTLSFPGETATARSNLFKTLDLSYDLLPTDARRVFCIAAVFPRRIDDDFVEYVFGEAAITHLELLYSYSMIEIDERLGRRIFRYLEPARAYAAAQLPGEFLELKWQVMARAVEYFLSKYERYLSANSSNPFSDDYLSNEHIVVMLLDWGLLKAPASQQFRRSAPMLALYVLRFRHGHGWLGDMARFLRPAVMCADDFGSLLIKCNLLLLEGDIHQSGEDLHAAHCSFIDAEDAAIAGELAPKAAEAARRQGEVLILQKQFQQAIVALQRASVKFADANLTAESRSCDLQTANAYFGLGELDEACQRYLQLTEVDDDVAARASSQLLIVYPNLMEGFLQECNLSALSSALLRLESLMRSHDDYGAVKACRARLLNLYRLSDQAECQALLARSLIGLCKVQTSCTRHCGSADCKYLNAPDS